METGIKFALGNIKRGRPAGWASGSEADTLPHAARPAFAQGVRLVENLRSDQQLAARHLMNGSANMADAAKLPGEVIAVLRTMDANFDYIASLVDSGVAKVNLPPYEY